ncbi:MAG: gfo/Idh/MocA family oxidoreductase [Phycisphaera sp.]|nr:gfo/Idh/MocA family oxidoreductase [Phycisphaera sp.]
MARKSSSKSKLRYAIIGAGGISHSHTNALMKFDDVEVVAAADVSDKSLEKYSKAFPTVTQTFKDYQELLDKVKPDAVSVCTPNGAHAPASIAAAKAGAHVIVEKPMAMNAKEGQAMADAAKKAGVKLLVGFQFRFHPKTQFIKAAREAGQFGDIMYARCQALRRRGIPNWGVFGRKDLQGGGPMIDIGVHVTEMAHYTMGSPKPVAAFGATWTYIGNNPKATKIASSWPNWDAKTYTVEDLAVGQVRFENGAILSIEASFAGHMEKDVWNFQLMGTKAGCDWENTEIFRDDAGYMLNSKPAFIKKTDWGFMFESKLRDFVDHVKYNKPTQNPLEDGLAIQKMLDGIYESAAAGKEVPIK